MGIKVLTYEEVLSRLCDLEVLLTTTPSNSDRYCRPVVPNTSYQKDKKEDAVFAYTSLSTDNKYSGAV